MLEGMELKLARIRKGFHLYEVARQVGISLARLSQYEGGTSSNTPRPGGEAARDPWIVRRVVERR